MTATAVAFLGAIALATVVMAAIQIGAIVYGARLARRTDRLVTRLEQDLGPIVERLNAMSADASRAASLAAVQVEKVDRMVADVAERVDRTMAAAQRALVVPAREGVALAAAVKATVTTLRELRQQQRVRRLGGDEDDALFIG